MNTITVSDIMSKEVVSIHPDTPLIEAAQILAEKRFDGMPVVDEAGVLVGILTEYDLISEGSAIHLPTFQEVLQNLPLFKKDRTQFQKEVETITALQVKDVMNKDPLTFREDVTFEEAVITFRDHHRVNPIPVLDNNHHVIGVVSRFDILKSLRLFSPQSDESLT